MGSRKQTRSSLKEYENRAYNYDDDTEDYAREFKKVRFISRFFIFLKLLYLFIHNF